MDSLLLSEMPNDSISPNKALTRKLILTILTIFTTLSPILCLHSQLYIESSNKKKMGNRVKLLEKIIKSSSRNVDFMSLIRQAASSAIFCTKTTSDKLFEI